MPHADLTLGGGPREEVQGQIRDVGDTLAQRWQLDLPIGNAMPEIVAKLAARAHCGEIAVGGRDHPDLRWPGAGGAEAPHLALLQHAQDARLGGRRHVADFVEEQTAAMGAFEHAGTRVDAGGDALLDAEQLGFQQVLGEGGAVDGDEGRRRIGTVLVHEAREQFLAGARFATDQHMRTAGGHAPGLAVQAPQSRIERLGLRPGQRRVGRRRRSSRRRQRQHGVDQFGKVGVGIRAVAGGHCVAHAGAVAGERLLGTGTEASLEPQLVGVDCADFQRLQRQLCHQRGAECARQLQPRRTGGGLAQQWRQRATGEAVDRARRQRNRGDRSVRQRRRVQRQRQFVVARIQAAVTQDDRPDPPFEVVRQFQPHLRLRASTLQMHAIAGVEIDDLEPIADAQARVVARHRGQGDADIVVGRAAEGVLVPRRQLLTATVGAVAYAQFELHAYRSRHGVAVIIRGWRCAWLPQSTDDCTAMAVDRMRQLG